MPKHHRKTTKRELPPGPWGDWQASPDDPRGEYYRARLGSDGNWEYDFHPYPFNTPRDADEVDDDLAAKLAGVDIGDQGDEIELEPSSPEYTTHPHPVDKGKGKATERDDDDDDNYPDEQDGNESDTTERGQGDDVDDSQFEEAVRQSRLIGRGGQPSGSEAYIPAEEPAYEVAEEEPPAEEVGELVGQPLSHERLDHRYRVRKSKNWVPGTVFKIYWSEPIGANGALSVSNKQVYQGEFGMSFYAGFRRFIIVATDEGHSTCVPVATYGGQGCRKSGVKPGKHGVIYGHGSKARRNDEPGLGYPPVRMKFTAEGEKLAPTSRVNYSKLMTIEHNCKVFFIGYIHPKDFDTVADAVDACWSGKKFFPGGHMSQY